MPTLLLKVRIELAQRGRASGWLGTGPLFYRWIPNGERDAIVLDTQDADAQLKVWFERWGYVANGVIRFDRERQHVDSQIVPTQAVLAAGPLLGSLEIRSLSDEEVAPMIENDIGDARYMGLGKRIVKDLLYPYLSTFLNSLRANYGQFWIRELERWDSRKRTLGDYCESELNLAWSLDGGRTWAAFVPDEPSRAPRVLTQDYFSQYLTQRDWQDLGEAIAEGYKPSDGALILSRAQGFLDRGDLRQAIVEGVSALEVALSEFIRKNLQGSDVLVESLQAFWSLPLRTQVVVAATLFGGIPHNDIEDALKVIDMRNKVVHEGWSPPDDAEVRFRGLRNTVAALVPGPKFRFPTEYAIVVVRPAEEWEMREARWKEPRSRQP